MIFQIISTSIVIILLDSCSAFLFSHLSASKRIGSPFRVSISPRIGTGSRLLTLLYSTNQNITIVTPKSDADQTPSEIAPSQPVGNGEWDDWDTDNYLTDDFVLDEDDPQLPSQTMLSSFGSAALLDYSNDLNRQVGVAIKVAEFINDPVNKPTKVIGYAERVEVLSLPGETKAVDNEFSESSGRGRGEWADWDENANYYDDVDDEISTQTSTTKGEPDKWKGWSEEAPYFDENDYIDEDGLFGRLNNDPMDDTESWKSKSSQKEILKDSWDPIKLYATIMIPENVDSVPVSPLLPLLALTLTSVGRPWQIIRSPSTIGLSDIIIHLEDMTLPLTPSVLRFISTAPSNTPLLDRSESSRCDTLLVESAVEMISTNRISGPVNSWYFNGKFLNFMTESEAIAFVFNSFVKQLDHLTALSEPYNVLNRHQPGRVWSTGHLALYCSLRKINQVSPALFDEYRQVDPDVHLRLSTFQDELESHEAYSAMTKSWMFTL